MRRFGPGALACGLALAHPGVALADGIDAMAPVAAAVAAVWALVALPLLAFASLTPPTNAGGRVVVSLFLLLVWGSAVLLAFGAEAPFVGLGLLSGVSVGLYRVWTSVDPGGFVG